MNNIEVPVGDRVKRAWENRSDRLLFHFSIVLNKTTAYYTLITAEVKLVEFYFCN
jgi:hypothetical protein